VFTLNATVNFATQSDVVEIGELSKTDIEYGLGWRYTPERMSVLLRDNAKNVVVARDGGSLAGFGIMTYADQHANLDLLAVKAPYRRRGIGTQIVSWLEQVARTAGIVYVYVQVRKINRDAVRFYRKCGFRIIDELPGYYRGTESAVVMCKSIGHRYTYADAFNGRFNK